MVLGGLIMVAAANGSRRRCERIRGRGRRGREVSEVGSKLMYKMNNSWNE